MRTPSDLEPAGRQLWADVAGAHPLTAAELAILHEACRTKDRLDRLARGGAFGQAPGLQLIVCPDAHNSTAQLLKQLIAALRLPDKHGRRPQRRGARGAYRPAASRQR